MTVIDKFSCRAKLLVVFFLILFSHQCALSEAADWRSVKEITVPGDDLVFTGSAAYRMGDYSAQLSMDIDNDGSEESIFLITDLNSWGIEFNKSCGKGSVLEQVFFHEVGAENLSEITFNISLHDFDSDNIPGIIVISNDVDGFINNGYVFKLGGSGVDLRKGNLHDLKGWISCVGSFNSYNNYWGVDGNVVRFKRSQTGYDYGIKVYVDGKLRDVAD